MNIPVAGLSINDGSTSTQALTTTPGAVTAWSATGGNVAPIPREGITQADQANNRLLLPRGYYVIGFDISLVGASGSADVIAQITRNGVAVPDGTVRVNVGTVRANLSSEVVVWIQDSQIPGTIAAFANPNDPSPSYVGQGGAPNSVCPIQLTLATVSGTITVTVEAGHFTAWKID